MISKGDNIKGFIVEEQLGSGGFGEVYLVHDAGHPTRRYAMKIIKTELTYDVAIRESFLNEMLNMARLSRHKNILTIVNSLIFNDGEDERVGMVMEYLRGVSLGYHIHHRGKLPPAEAVPVMLQLLDAIGYAHEMSIIHRDLTSSNVMVEPDGIVEYQGYKARPVKVLDFGLSKVLEGASATESMSGATLAYAAPERLKRGAQIDHRSDIYSLGVILFEMLTGRTPFVIRSLSDALELILHAQPQPVSEFDDHLPSELDAIIGRAMAKEPDDRYASCEEMARALKAIFPPGFEEGAIFTAPPEVPPRIVEEPSQWVATLMEEKETPLAAQTESEQAGLAPDRGGDSDEDREISLEMGEMHTVPGDEEQKESRTHPKPKTVTTALVAVGVLLLLGVGYFAMRQPSELPDLREETDKLPPVASVMPTPESSVKDTGPDEDAQPGKLPEKEVTWERIFGGPGEDEANCVQQTEDGGYIVAGTTRSFGKGSSDAWVVKMDARGNEVWSRTYGGSGSDGANVVQQTSDGGYIVIGWTESYGKGHSDIFVVKLDDGGKEQWRKTFGGKKDEQGTCIQKTDGSYILTGWTLSRGSGLSDALVIKIDRDGKELWNKVLGRTSFDALNDIARTTDGGYALAGYTFSQGNGKGDMWIVRLDQDGKKIWEKCCGGDYEDKAFSVRQTVDGGFIVAGDTQIKSGEKPDACVIKLDGRGNEVWKKNFGGNKADKALSVQQTVDGEYVVAGYTRSYGKGESDAWLIRLDGQGNEVWNRTFGGAKEEKAVFVRQTRDGGYIVAGKTSSRGNGQSDAMVLKLNAEGNLQPEE